MATNGTAYTCNFVARFASGNEKDFSVSLIVDDLFRSTLADTLNTPPVLVRKSIGSLLASFALIVTGFSEKSATPLPLVLRYTVVSSTALTGYSPDQSITWNLHTHSPLIS